MEVSKIKEFQNQEQKLLTAQKDDISKLSRSMDTTSSVFNENLNDVVVLMDRLVQEEVRKLLELRDLAKRLVNSQKSKEKKKLQMKNKSLLLHNIENQFDRIGLAASQINKLLLDYAEQAELDSFKLDLKQSIQRVGNIYSAIKTKSGQILIGCSDGLFQLEVKERKLILGGGNIFGLAVDQEGSVFGTSNISGFSLFKIDSDFKVQAIVAKAPVYYGLCVAKDKIYFTANESGYKVMLLEKGQTRELMRSRRVIYSLASFNGILYVGEDDRISQVDRDGKINTVLTSCNGVKFDSVTGLSICDDRLLIADHNNSRVVSAKIKDDRLTSQKLIQVESGNLQGVHSAGNEVLVCDYSSQKLLFLLPA